MKITVQSLFIAITLMAVAVSCGKEPEQPTVAVKGVTISPESIDIEIGDQKVLTAMVSPSGNARKDVRGTLSQAAIFPGVSFTFIDEPHFQELYAKLADPKTSQEELWDTDHEIQQWIFDEALAMPICEYNAAFGYNSNLLSPEIFTPICFAERYMLRDLALKTTWGK